MADVEMLISMKQEALSKDNATNPDGGSNSGSDKKKGEGLIKGGLKKAGISFSLASILKQSQIFTGFLGSLFQILGGMVDLMLVPLIPPMMAFLTWLAKQMPLISKIGAFFVGSFVDHFMGIFNNFKKAFELFKEAWGLIKDGEIWQAAKKIFQGIGYLLWGVIKLYFTGILLSWGRVFFLLPGLIDKIKEGFRWLKDKLTVDFLMLVVLKGIKFLTDALTSYVNYVTYPMRTVISLLKNMEMPRVLGGGKPFSGLPDTGAFENPLANKIEILIAGLTPQQTVEAEQGQERVRVSNLDQQILSAGV
jgi:hypothetical protein